MNEVLSDESLPHIDRRTLLWLLLATAGVCSMRAGVKGVRANQRASGPGAMSDLPAVPGSPMLANLGASLAATDPAAARRLGHYALREARRLGIDLANARGVAHLSGELLAAARVRLDFAHGRLETIDGWMLARSEAAACVILHRMSLPAVCVPDVC